MHKDFFDKTQAAIDQGYYLEAMFLEYAAIESRLEIMLGVLGMPCHSKQDAGIRKSVQISHRINCLDQIKGKSLIFENTKLPPKYFSKLKSWLDKRNRYIHGLYKDASIYGKRISESKKLATDGLEFCRLLYNETKRMRRRIKNHPEFLQCDCITCCSKDCCLYSLDNKQVDI